jgi:DNA-binding FrmR family transcriptional regulator
VETEHGREPREHRQAAPEDRGQVTGIRRMQEDGRYCIDVLDQISAARAGLEATALLILEDHVNGCVREAIDEGKGEEKAAELLEAVGRFARSV